mgnify:CR=1 FL=1
MMMFLQPSNTLVMLFLSTAQVKWYSYDLNSFSEKSMSPPCLSSTFSIIFCNDRNEIISADPGDFSQC